MNQPFFTHDGHVWLYMCFLPQQVVNFYNGNLLELVTSIQLEHNFICSYVVFMCTFSTASRGHYENISIFSVG